MTAPPAGYVQIAGVSVPVDLAPTLIEAIRTIYAVQTDGLDDEAAVAVVTVATMVDVLDRYAVWQGARDMQTNLGPLQQAVTDAQQHHQQLITDARQAARAAAGRILSPGQQPPV